MNIGLIFLILGANIVKLGKGLSLDISEFHIKTFISFFSVLKKITTNE